MRVPKLAALLAAVPLAVATVACGSDDGRPVGGGSAATETAPGDGVPAAGPGTTGAEPLVRAAVADYTEYVDGQVDLLIARTATFTDAVRAGDLRAARAAYAPSREPWERIEPIAGLVPDIDAAVDARADDFAGPGDPAFTGWHRLEHLLWQRNTTAGGARFADRLDADLARLEAGMARLEIPPPAVALGAAELIQEVAEGKVTGEEDRYSKTDLWDVAANVEGAEKVIEVLEPALRRADAGLHDRIDAGFRELEASLAPLRRGDGYVRYCQEDDPFPSPRCPRPTVTVRQVKELKAQLAGLSEDLALVPGALGLS